MFYKNSVHLTRTLHALQERIMFVLREICIFYKNLCVLQEQNRIIYLKVFAGLPSSLIN